jgi:hypothetical protein
MRAEVVYLSHAGPLPVLPGSGARAPLSVIADLIEEHFERVLLPRARGRDLEQLLARRLAQQFPDTPYRLALPLRAGSGEATHVLIGAPADRIDAHLKPLVASGHAVRGVWTVALLVSWWLRLARLRPPHLLAVIPTPAGVRHVYLCGGIPAVSRLVPRDLAGHDSAGLDEELQRTVQYLYNARLIGRGVSLPAWFLGSGKDTPTQQEQLRWHRPPAAHGLPDIGSRGVVALAELLQLRPPPAQLAPPPLRIHWHARRIRTATATAATLLSAVLLAAGMSAAVQAGVAKATTAALRAEIATIERAERAAAGAAAPSGVTPRFAAAALRIHRSQVEAAPLPQAALFAVAPAFEAAPEFALQEAVWRAGDARSTAPSATEETAGAGCAVPSGDETAVLRLTGTVGPEVPLRQAVAARERFERALGQHAGLRYTLQRAPVEPEGPLDSAGGVRSFAYCVWLRSPR